MNSSNINALATSVIASATIIGLMFGFYYNLKTANTEILKIITFELLFVIAIGLVIIQVRGAMENE